MKKDQVDLGKECTEMPHRFLNGHFCISLVLTFVVITAPCLAKVKRHDTVIMKNGDRLTGEIKKLEQGVLYIETDYFSGSVGVDWLQVDKVESKATFQIVLNDGQRISGSISKEAVSVPGEDFKVHAPTGGVPVSSVDVVQIESRKQTFWRQLKGSIDFGYNFTSGNNQSSLNTPASAVYPAERWAVGTSYNVSFSGQTGGTTTNLFESQTFADRFLNRNSFVIGLGDFLHSSQQDLSLRTTLGGGYGRYLKRSNQNSLRWLVGADYTKGNYQAGLSQPTQNNLELLLGAEYQLFHFDRYTLQSQFLLFPGLSDFGRVRFTTNDTFSIRLSNNFHLNFSFWDNFDSRPPLSAKKNATGLSTGLGWTF
jgi:putative salt-induced outer membrane protein YdiY